jgi:hypothetical protein
MLRRGGRQREGLRHGAGRVSLVVASAVDAAEAGADAAEAVAAAGR